MAVTEERVDRDATLADLLQRVEALEADQAKHVRKKNKMTIVAWGGQLDRIWPTTILATTAAASGMEASVFFTFWGLFAIVKPGVRITGDNWMQKMMSFMNRGGTEHLHLSKMDFAGMGPAMMKKLADEHHVASPQELLEVARDLGVELIPCGMTMDLLGLTKDDLIDGLADPAGATTALAQAQDAVTLFI